jgi:DNA repair protein RecN (Recombination protein N)
MPSASLEFRVQAAPMGPTGADQVTIMLAANPGTAPAPLARAASGGELSRVRLALEVVLAATEQNQTFVFDEIDAGVGGAVGIEIGRRLARLARRHQVIVVTHLPQVAAFADCHLVVTKASDGRITRSGVRQVSGADRRSELARMMTGMADSELAVEHAQELLDLRSGLG